MTLKPVLPERLFEFRHPELDAALRDISGCGVAA